MQPKANSTGTVNTSYSSSSSMCGVSKQTRICARCAEMWAALTMCALLSSQRLLFGRNLELRRVMSTTVEIRRAKIERQALLFLGGIVRLCESLPDQCSWVHTANKYYLAIKFSLYTRQLLYVGLICVSCGTKRASQLKTK